jgi:methionine synthase II (cobalamin-independent)
VTRFSSILTGIHPLSESLIRKIFDFKYGRTPSPDIVKKAFKDDIKDLTKILLQTSAIAVSTGNLGWWDIFRPFSEELGGLITNKDTKNLPVARIPLTNTFYRQPIITGRLFSDASILKNAKHPFLDGNILQTPFLPSKLKNNAWSICLPGPFSFSRAAAINEDGDKVYKYIDDLMIDFSEILISELKFLSSLGYSHIVVNESFLTWESIERDTIALLNDLWSQISSSTSLNIAFHTYNQLPSDILHLLINSKAWAIGIDCLRNNVQELLSYDINGKSLVAGVVDAQSYFRDTQGELVVENSDELIKLGSELAESQAKEIILAPTSRLEFVPRVVADLKVQQLGKVIPNLLKDQ